MDENAYVYVLFTRSARAEFPGSTIISQVLSLIFLYAITTANIYMDI